MIVARNGAAELKTQEVTEELKAALSRMAQRLEALPSADR